MGGGCSNVTVDPALRDKYTVGKEIGRGAYGIIREAKAKPPARSLGIPEKVAIKIFTKTNNPAGTRTPNEMRLRKLKSDFNHNRFIDEEDKAMAKANIAVLQRIDATEVRKSPLEQILHEVKVLTDLKHPCMVEMHEWVQSEDRIYMVMELCTGGNLQEKLAHANSLTESVAARFLYDALAGLAFLHSENVVHRDLKPANLLLTHEDVETSRIKLCDFGLAVRVASETSLLDEKCGSSLYQAPEMIAGVYSKPADVWALGTVLYLMCFGEHPRYSMAYSKKVPMEKCNKKLKPTYEPWNPHRYSPSSELKDLFKKMTKLNPKTRWTAEQCLAHPFFFQNLPEGWSKPPITVSAPHAAMGGLRSKRMSIHGAEVDMEEQMKMFQSQGLAGDDHEEEDSP